MLLLLAYLLSYNFAWTESASLGIINGTNANIADYPWMVAIYEKFGYFYCGGFLISPEWVLTAGHCAPHAALVKIRAGSDNLDDDKGVFIDVARVRIHPNFTQKDDGTPLNDLTLLGLKSEVNGNNISPIKLPESNTPIPEGESITVTGWGDTTGNSNFPKNLQVVSIDIPVIQSCIDAYKRVNYTVNPIGEFCAGTIGDTKGTCHGDSGGPAEINGTVYGIVSWGLKGCSTAKMPDVLVKIANYRDWIRDVTGI